MARKELIYGFKGFTNYLKESLTHFQQAPVLLIQSHALLDSQVGKLRDCRAVSDACRRAHFILCQQLNLRTVLAHSSGDYSFPTTPSSPDSVLDLARRTGASSLVAVGSGQAIDLAKTVSGAFESIVLIPATYTATMVSGSSHALLLDKAAETLVPSPSEADDHVVVIPEHSFLHQETRDTAIFAAISILIDAMIWAGQGEDVQVFEDLLKNLVDNLHVDAMDKVNHELLCRSLLNTGGFISYGLGPFDRSIPIAILASLLPTVFTNTDATTLMASTVSSLHRLLLEQNRRVAVGSILRSTHLHAAPTIVTTEPMTQLLSYIQENQAHWQSIDVQDRVYLELLKDFVLG